MIPEQLKECRFVKILFDTKKPVEENWPDKNNYAYDSPELKEWLTNGNYGVLCGTNNLTVIDIDFKSPNFEKALFKVNELPQTFTVQTPGGGHHFYYTIKGIESSRLKNQVGEIRNKGMCVVGPNSQIGEKKYFVERDLPIIEITKEQLLEKLQEWIIPKIPTTENETQKETDQSRSGKEFAQVCKYIKAGLTKEQVFKDMMVFAKWSTAPPQYRELTYEKAFAKIEQGGQTQKNLTNIQNKVLQLILLKNKNEATELLAQMVQEKTKIYATRFDERNEIYYYEDGIYKSEGKTFIKEQCRKVLGSAYTEQFTNIVISKIEADNYIEQDKFLKRHYPNKICCKNGILNVKTKTLEPFTPDKIFFTKINAAYDVNAQCEKIDSFLSEVLSDEADIETIKEFFGYCLLGGYPIQKITLFIGEGGNGKGQTLELLRQFLGEKNYSGIPLQKLEENDFKERELFNKLANIGADISDAPLKSTAKLKGLSGGDVINASVKFKNDITFQNETKLVFSANKLPKTYDLTPAFFRRWVYIVYPFRFLTASEISSMPLEKRKNLKVRTDDIIKSLITDTELSGLLNEALKGLERLLSTGEFTSSKTSDATMKWWINNSDSLLGFCYEHIEEDVDSMLSKDEFRKEYQKYCHFNRVSSEGDSHIKETLTRTFHAWDYQDSSGQRYWKGLKFVSSKVIIIPEKL